MGSAVCALIHVHLPVWGVLSKGSFLDQCTMLLRLCRHDSGVPIVQRPVMSGLRIAHNPCAKYAVLRSGRVIAADESFCRGVRGSPAAQIPVITGTKGCNVWTVCATATQAKGLRYSVVLLARSKRAAKTASTIEAKPAAFCRTLTTLRLCNPQPTEKFCHCFAALAKHLAARFNSCLQAQHSGIVHT